MLLYVDPYDYRLYILIQGIPEGINFEVERQTGEKLQALLAEANEDHAFGRFFCFACVDGKRVALSLDDVEMINYLQDIRHVELRPQAEIDEEATDIEIYFRDRPNPYQTVANNSEEIDLIFEELESNLFVEYQYLSFTDQDDELVTVNVARIVLLTAKPQVLEELDEEEIDSIE